MLQKLPAETMLVQRHLPVEVRVLQCVYIFLLDAHLWHFKHSPYQWTAMSRVSNMVLELLQPQDAQLWCM